MTNRHKAAVVLNDLSIHQQVIAKSISRIAELLEMAISENRDLTDREADVVMDLMIERQPKIKNNVMRSIMYRAEL
jgi:hypothetical protein